MTTIQVQYDPLESIASRFERHAQETAALRQRLAGHSARLEASWQGKASGRFEQEMQRDLLPALERLVEALAEARNSTHEIARTFQRAEEEAAALFRVDSAASATESSRGISGLASPLRDEAGGEAGRIAEAARRGDWAEVHRLLSAPPPDRRAEVAFELGDSLDDATLKQMYAGPEYGVLNTRMLIDGMVEYVRQDNTQATRDLLATVLYSTTHAGLIDESGDATLPQEIIERARRDPEYGHQIAAFLNRYASWPPRPGLVRSVTYEDGEMILTTMIPSSGFPTSPYYSRPPLIIRVIIDEADLQSLYSDGSYSGLNPTMPSTPVQMDEYSFTVTVPNIPPGMDAEEYIYSRILAQMAEPHGRWPLQSTFNFPGIEGMPQRGDALPLDLPDPGFVVVSQGFPVLRIRTVTFPGVDTHPINGAREWGVEQIGPDTYRVYTRATARDDTWPGMVARGVGLERDYWRHLIGDVAIDLTPDGHPVPPVDDWTFEGNVPPPSGDSP